MAQSDGTLIFDTKIITDGFKKGLSSLGSVAVKGVGAISATFAAASGAALKFSGELEQNLGGSEAVFKEYAKSVQTAADTAFKNMGLSTSDFLATANKMGALFQGSGFAISESAELSAKTMQRAADVASIMGIDVSMAMESIAGAAKGNFTMMDNLGVAMNDTTIAAYALEKGVKKSTREMTNQEKIGLAMQMFLEKTEYATGNYAKENETLAGALSTAKAALENFLSGSGDPIELAESLGSAAEVIIKKLGELTPHLASGLSEVFDNLAPMIPDLITELVSGISSGANKLADSFGDMFAELITVIADSAPDIINAGIALIESFINGIVNNADQIANAAVKICNSLINGIIKIVPQIVSAAGKIVSAFASELGKISPILKPLISVFKLLAENIDVCVIAFISWKAAMLAVSAISAAVTFVKTMTTAVKGATIAQKLWNAAITSNPWGALATAIASAITVIYATIKNMDAETEAVKRNKEAVEELADAYESYHKSNADAIKGDLASITNAENLYKELTKLASASGEVEESDRSRANYIINELNKALGTEIKMTDGVIQGYESIQSAIHETMKAKQKEILMGEATDNYSEAIKNIEAAKAALLEAQKNYSPNNSESVKALEEAQEAYKKYSDDIITYSTACTMAEESSTEELVNYLNFRRNALNDGIHDLEGYNSENDKKLKMLADNYQSNLAGLTALIKDYDGSEAMQNMINDMINDIEINKSDIEALGGEIKDGVISGFESGEDVSIMSATDWLADAAASGNIYGGEFSESFFKSINTYLSGNTFGKQLELDTFRDKVIRSYGDIFSSKSFAPVMQQNKDNGEESAGFYADGVVLGLKSREPQVRQGGYDLADATDSGWKTRMNQHSPSKVGEENGSYYVKGVEGGFKKETPALEKTSAQSAEKADNAFKDELDINSPSKVGYENGEFYIEGVENGVISESDNLEGVAEDAAKRMNKAFAENAKLKIADIRGIIGNINNIKEEPEDKQKAFDAEVKKIKARLDFGLDSEEQYYNNLEYLRDNYLTESSDAWIDATKEIYDYQQTVIQNQMDVFEDVKDGVKEMYDDIADYAIDKLEEVENKQNKLAEKLNEDTAVVEKVTIKAGDDSMEFYRLNDLSDEKENASAYKELLNQVVERVQSSGISEDAISGVLNQIDDLDNDNDGREILKVLLTADDKTFARQMQNYADVYATNQGTATQRYSTEMAEAVDDSYKYMMDALTEAGFEIPEGFFVSGTLSAEKFGEAFMAELELQMQEIQTKIIDFNTKLGNSLGVGSQNVNNDNRSTTYNIYGDSQSTVSQIKNYETIKRLSGQ